MTLSYKNVTPSATSTTTQTQINGATDFTIPQQVTEMIEFTPYIVANTPTAGQTINSDLIVQSNAINVNPTRTMIPAIQAGLGATFNTIHPILTSFKWNVPTVNPNAPQIGIAPPMQFFNQGLVTNTAEPLVGCDVMLSDQALSGQRQTFWNKRNGVTSTGTAAATVTETTWQVAGATAVHTLMAQIYSTTVTANESVDVNVNFASPDMQTPLPAQIECQPLSGALGATGSTLAAALLKWPCYIPVNPILNLSPAITLQKAVTVASNVGTGVGFYKN